MISKQCFQWDDKFGDCYDCGRPAAYYLVGPEYRGDDGPLQEYRLRCAACAAQAAWQGESIYWLFEKEAA